VAGIDDSGEYDGGAMDPFLVDPEPSTPPTAPPPPVALTTGDHTPVSVPGRSLPPGAALGPANLGPDRFCPLHGPYSAEDEQAECPLCKEDPIGSSASLRRVRVVTERELAPEDETNDGETTPIADLSPCPSCGRATPLADFRVESIGEVWEGPAAVWAEDGVCPTCWSQVLPPHVREWSNAEWMAHHYESWRATVEAVHDVFVYEETAADGWLPTDERLRIIDVEGTLSARREHLARSQQTMRELQSRYGASMTPPPFQMALASGAAATGPDAVTRLRELRALGVQRKKERAIDSQETLAPPAAMIDEWLEDAAETQKMRVLRRTGQMPTADAGVEDVPEEVPDDPFRWLPWAVGALVVAAIAAWLFVLLR
jgi:hypothetical protein